eukprot:TRINITY_DN54694_c0_g1_i1.p1 TRINITY_DN54694_c0_g1~~TRINITY_DN54694_c0_g1_i1.p1  ORF type:complete len:634 (-),score=61.37 TRINITY_DN54694_c0_g1_i1:86-1909(-)
MADSSWSSHLLSSTSSGFQDSDAIPDGKLHDQSAKLPVSIVFRLIEARYRLYDAFGSRFVHFLMVTYFGLKGLSFSLLTAMTLPILKGFGASGRTFQLTSVFATTPWCMIGWIGVMSDCFPLGGYHIRRYLLWAALLGVLGNAVLSCTAVFDGFISGPWACWLCAILLFLTNWHFATFDTLTEGKCAELMRRSGAGSEAMSLVWCSTTLGALASGCIVMCFVDRWGPHALVTLALGPALMSLFLSGRGDLPEVPAIRGFSKLSKFRSDPQLFSLALAMAIGALALAAAAVTPVVAMQFGLTLGVSAVLLLASFRVLPWRIAKANLYMFIAAASYADLSGALAYFYTADSSCVLDGPSFSYSYYLAVTAIAGSVCGSLGCLLFQFMRTWSFRMAFCTTTCVQIVAAGFDLLIVKRWNLHVGIPDKAMYLFGDASCQQLAQMLVVMPGVLLIARLCPRGAEATVYAILAGFHNLGANVASLLGVWLTDILSIQSSAQETGECDFSQLGLAILIGHCVMPVACLPLVLWLVPNESMDDDKAFSFASPPPSFASSRASSAPPSPKVSFCGSVDHEEPFFSELPTSVSEGAGKREDGVSFTMTGLAINSHLS